MMSQETESFNWLDLTVSTEWLLCSLPPSIRIYKPFAKSYDPENDLNKKYGNIKISKLNCETLSIML